MKIIITGASGFIGSLIYKKLKSLHYDVVRVSRKKIYGYYFSKDYLSLPDGDVLIHLGESSNRGLVNEQGEKLFLQNKNIIKHINEKKYYKVIYGSSSLVYGDKITEPRNEKEKTTVSDNYSKIKIFSENNLNHSNNIVFRLSNVYGNGMSKDNVISDILSQLRKKEPMILRQLNPVRDFIYIDDVIDAFIAAIKTDHSGIFNVGSGVSLSIRSLTKKILDLDNQPNRIIESSHEHLATKSHISLDITRICNIMPRLPLVCLDEGLLNIIFNEKKHD
jgi:nucleoside-diphosphate-sugar epimerase